MQPTRTRPAGVTRWPDGPIAALDTETTGLDPRHARCVEVALVVVGPEGVPTAGGYRTLVDCGAPIPPEATRIHGIRDEDVAAEGVPARECFEQLVLHLASLERRGIPVVVYNARFDWPLLRAEVARFGLALPDVHLVDPMVVDRHLDRYRRGKRRLADLADHYGIEPGRAHRAHDDALAAARLAQAVAAAFPEEVAAVAPRELHRRQRSWFAHWRDDLNEWLRGQGAERVVAGEWPG
jgi:DNA polymerase III subunit epsilon